MALAFSRSQGKIIEVPDEQLPQLQIQAAQQGSVTSADTNVGSGVTVAPTGQTQATTQPLGMGKQISIEQMSKVLLNPNISSKTKTNLKTIFDLQQKAIEKQNDLIKEKEKIKAKKEEESAPDPAVLNVINELEKAYFSEEGKKSLAFGRAGPLGRSFGTYKNLRAKLIPGDEETERITIYNDLVNSSLARMAKAGGDAANIAVAEQIFQKKGLPTFGSTPKEAIEKFKTIRAKLNLGESELLKKAEGDIEGVKKRRGEAGLGIFDPVLGATKNTIQDIVTGITAKNTQKSANTSIKTAKNLMDQAMKTKDPKQKLILINQAQQIFSEVGKNQEEIVNNFSQWADDMSKLEKLPPNKANALLILKSLMRGATVGTQVAMTAGLVSGGINQVQNLRSKGLGGIKNGFRPTIKGRNIRTNAINQATKDGVKIDGNSVLKSLIEKARQSRANLSLSQQKKLINDYLKGAARSFGNKKITPKMAKRIWDQANKGFTQSGKLGNTVEAEYNRLLRSALRTHLNIATNGAFEEGTTLISKGLSRGQFLNNLARRGSQIGAVATPLLILRSLLKDKNKNDYYGQ